VEEKPKDYIEVDVEVKKEVNVDVEVKKEVNINVEEDVEENVEEDVEENVEEDVEEEEGIALEEVEIKGKIYYVTEDKINGPIYKFDEETEEPVQIGKYKNGKAKFS
jgi:uncharacterized phage protein gp47/JayE